MNIGVDLDGVVYNSELWLQAAAEIYNTKFLGAKPIVNIAENSISKRYDWSDEFAKRFRLKYLSLQIMHSELQPLSKQTLEMLLKENHQIFLITSRGTISEIHKDLTFKRLQEDKIPYTDIYFTQQSKVDICKEKHIEVMIDDTPQVIYDLINNDITCLYFKNGDTVDIFNDKVNCVKNWGDVYSSIAKISGTKIKAYDTKSIYDIFKE